MFLLFSHHFTYAEILEELRQDGKVVDESDESDGFDDEEEDDMKGKLRKEREVHDSGSESPTSRRVVTPVPMLNKGEGSDKPASSGLSLQPDVEEVRSQYEIDGKFRATVCDGFRDCMEATNMLDRWVDALEKKVDDMRAEFRENFKGSNTSASLTATALRAIGAEQISQRESLVQLIRQQVSRDVSEWQKVKALKTTPTEDDIEVLGGPGPQWAAGVPRKSQLGSGEGGKVTTHVGGSVQSPSLVSRSSGTLAPDARRDRAPMIWRGGERSANVQGPPIDVGATAREIVQVHRKGAVSECYSRSIEAPG